MRQPKETRERKHGVEITMRLMHGLYMEPQFFLPEHAFRMSPCSYIQLWVIFSSAPGAKVRQNQRRIRSESNAEADHYSRDVFWQLLVQLKPVKLSNQTDLPKD